MRRERFHNPDPAHRPHGSREVFRWGVLDRIRGVRKIGPAGPPAPRVDPDLTRIHAGDGVARATWIGHASFLITLDGASVLIDPVFSDRIGTVVPRYGRPGMRFADVPPIHALMISHCHYDHLDLPSIRVVPRSTPVFVPSRLGEWFRRTGFEDVTELGWWQTAETDALRITLVPARHWSRRFLFDTNRTLWGGFVIQSATRSVYHAGDSAWFDGFREIGRRFPGLDAALLPIGSYDPPWFMEAMHMNPEQAGAAFLDSGARRMIAMHWGTFRLTDERLAEPAERAHAWWLDHDPGDGREMLVPSVGQTIELHD
ncbi:MAG: MBL fold metallo-hydrolase [bacterium]|nr:MBL fold metallo-hydrolase [bacterium]